MSKHTPGPWHPPHFADSETKCNCGHIFSEHQDHMGSVCTVKWDPADMGFDAQRKAEAIANAHLIAAAPDMYEAGLALIEADDAIEASMAREVIPEGDQEFPRLLAARSEAKARFRAAISKAKGEA